MSREYRGHSSLLQAGNHPFLCELRALTLRKLGSTILNYHKFKSKYENKLNFQNMAINMSCLMIIQLLHISAVGFILQYHLLPGWERQLVGAFIPFSFIHLVFRLNLFWHDSVVLTNSLKNQDLCNCSDIWSTITGHLELYMWQQIIWKKMI